MEPAGTWTAYPSLLLSPPEDVQRVALEDAACAHYSGRYQDAEAIFTSKLPASHTEPILALQRADMFTTQGREHECIGLLKLALQDPAVNEEQLKSMQLLLRFMLADAELWALGQIEAVVDLLPTIRRHIRSRDIKNLLDVEVVSFFNFFVMKSSLI